MSWETVERPGYFGKKKDSIIEAYDKKYGEGNWRIVWKWGEDIICKDLAYKYYEDAYYIDSKKREALWLELKSVASEVYDIEPRDIESGLDYNIQKGPATHLQDISIRRVFDRRDWEFEGDELVQIRSKMGKFGDALSPGNVMFHHLTMIEKPFLDGWWNNHSIESFYQNNKILQVKKNS